MIDSIAKFPVTWYVQVCLIRVQLWPRRHEGLMSSAVGYCARNKRYRKLSLGLGEAVEYTRLLACMLAYFFDQGPPTPALFMSIIPETVWLRASSVTVSRVIRWILILRSRIGPLRLFSGGTLMPLSMVIRERAGIRNSFYPLSFPPCACSPLSVSSVYLSHPLRALGDLPIWIYIDPGSD